jgi:hypothetical protein
LFVSSQRPPAPSHLANLKYRGIIDLAHLKNVSQSCGYETLLDKVTYPQLGGHIALSLPEPDYLGSCDIFNDMLNTASEINVRSFLPSFFLLPSSKTHRHDYWPCFNVYRITDVCPTPVDAIGNGSYFSRPDVQAALHVPGSGTWSECTVDYPFVNQTDNSAYTVRKSSLSFVHINLSFNLAPQNFYRLLMMLKND